MEIPFAGVSIPGGNKFDFCRSQFTERIETSDVEWQAFAIAGVIGGLRQDGGWQRLAPHGANLRIEGSLQGRSKLAGNLRDGGWAEVRDHKSPILFGLKSRGVHAFEMRLIQIDAAGGTASERFSAGEVAPFAAGSESRRESCHALA